MARPTSRPGRTLFVFFLVTAALFGLAAMGGTWKPKLGLDLEGGTRITLTAIGKGINAEKMRQAQEIIDARVNGTGVAESEVSTQGSRNIIVEIPGEQRKDLVESVARTAQLRFRIVASPGPVPPASAATPSPTPTPTPSPSGSPSPTPSPSASPSATVEPSPGEGSNRPAPGFDSLADPTPAPAPSPTQAPAADEGPADPLAWAASPPASWQQKLVEYECPKTGAAPVADDPDKPLVTCDEDGNRFLLTKAIIEGTSLRSASHGVPPQGVGWVVQLSLKGDAVKVFADTSRKLVNDPNGLFAMVLDGQVISYAGFSEPILDGNAQITGDFSEAEAAALANSLKFGALPITFAEPSVETIGPSLAGSQLSAGILAGGIGLAIVMLYCLLYYRGLGIVVIASLVIAAAITYAIVLLLAEGAGLALTLPGIAGLIVAVGITADSFIVYFERIRDEMREGRSMRVAVEAGWRRARNTCLAADAVSFLAAIVLYIFAIGVVRGFAFMLGIATVIDVVVFFFFTKPLVSLFARYRFFNSGSKLSGLSAETLGIDHIAPDRAPATAGGRA